MKKQISAIVDKLLTKGMALMESERAQQILSSPQAQKAMDFGIAALGKAQEASEAFKSIVAARLGLATQKEMDELRDEITRLEAENAALKKEADKADGEAPAEKAEDKEENKD